VIHPIARDVKSIGNVGEVMDMELVKGVPITKYCDNHRLTLQARLELFIPVSGKSDAMTAITIMVASRVSPRADYFGGTQLKRSDRVQRCESGDRAIGITFGSGTDVHLIDQGTIGHASFPTRAVIPSGGVAERLPRAGG
jgi:hypothetical protein